MDLGDSGFYSVTLGSDGNPIGADVLSGGERWLQISVDGTKMKPRLRLDSAPYAALAGEAESVSEGAIGSDALADGAVDSDSLSEGAVDQNAIADGAVGWDGISNKPSGFADGTDDDTLAELMNCKQGYVARYDGNAWNCVDSSTSVAGRTCGSGKVARGFEQDGSLICTEDKDTTLDESQVDQFVSNNGYAKQSSLSSVATSGDYGDLNNKPQLSSVATSGDFGDLQNVPQGLSDGDDDTQLDESQVDQFVSNNGYAKQSSLSSVATSGDYGDLNNKPQLSSVATSGDFGDLQNVPQGLSDGDDEGVTGSGTSGKIAKFSGKTKVGDSNLHESAGGYVGVGTSSPSKPLDVDGDIRVRGQIEQDCSGGAASFEWSKNGRCYVRFDLAKNFVEARRFCKKIGGTLFTPASVTEHIEVYQHLGKGSLIDHWLGYTDAHEEANWQAITGDIRFSLSGGRAVQVGLWTSGEPSGDGDCAEFVASSNSKWNDLPCDTRQGFVCALSTRR